MSTFTVVMLKLVVAVIVLVIGSLIVWLGNIDTRPKHIITMIGCLGCYELGLCCGGYVLLVLIMGDLIYEKSEYSAIHQIWRNTRRWDEQSAS